MGGCRKQHVGRRGLVERYCVAAERYSGRTTFVVQKVATGNLDGGAAARGSCGGADRGDIGGGAEGGDL